MNEFEWRRQMRSLREPLAPPPELWSSIDAALDAAGSTRASVESVAMAQPPKRRQLWLAAASFAALALLGGALATRYLRAPTTRTTVASIAPVATRDWKPVDPRLAGAATQLDAARKELQQAIQQAPESPALQRLLRRTEQQQTQLQQLAHEAG
jgi:hypothetical protein